jgi:hypothetical protein
MDMNKTHAILSKGQKLYEDGHYILLWTKFFGLSLLALTSYYVYVKSKKELLKLNGRERTYLLGVSYYLTKQFKMSPREVIENTTLFKDFSRAIAERGGEYHQQFFSEKPKEKAQTYALQTSPRFKKGKH